MRISSARLLLAAFVAVSPVAASVAGPAPAPTDVHTRIADAVRRDAAASVVHIVTTGYRPVRGTSDATTPVVRRQSLAGSGVVIDDGLIATTSALLAGADEVLVTLPSSGGRRARSVRATLAGLAPEVGLALLRVEAASAVGLRAVAIASPANISRGLSVFTLRGDAAGALGVTPTTVEAVALSVEPMSATAWIQTAAAPRADACGGPVVDATGALVGLTTCPDDADSTAGYAIPGAVLALAAPQLREFGHLHRARLGLTIEAISPEMRRGLGLGPTPGVIVADVVPGGPAEAAGLAPGDMLTAIGGRALADVSMTDFSQHLLALTDGALVPIALERAGRPGLATVTAVVPDHDCARPGLVDVDAHVIAALGVIGVPVEPALMEFLPDLRADTGVVVLWQIDGPRPGGLALTRGDVIHAVNGESVATPAEVRERLRRVPRGTPVVLQVARAGALTFMTAATDLR